MINVKLITGRTIKQGESMGDAKFTAVCEMDPSDMEKLGIKEGDVVRVSTNAGKVLLKAVKSAQAPHEGIAFIPLGPWANAVIDPNTDSIGMPSFKGVRATIEPAKGEKVPSDLELIMKYVH
jgi:formylmethanofuran dehydrogenase subunit D